MTQVSRKQLSYNQTKLFKMCNSIVVKIEKVEMRSLLVYVYFGKVEEKPFVFKYLHKKQLSKLFFKLFCKFKLNKIEYLVLFLVCVKLI